MAKNLCIRTFGSNDMAMVPDDFLGDCPCELPARDWSHRSRNICTKGAEECKFPRWLKANDQHNDSLKEMAKYDRKVEPRSPSLP